MISAGANIVGNADTLHKVTIKYVYDSLRHPRPDIVSSIRQLRIVKEIDNKQYAMLKRRLPYLVCAMFNPPYRKTENFAYTEYFIIDIDHLSDKSLSPKGVRERIEKDSRVVLSFLSPGEDGLKVLFKLKERCYDSGLYSLFYKAFLVKFSSQYGLEQVVDTKTSDVTRACFFSVDPEAYYNPNADVIDINSYINADSSYSLFEQKRQQDILLKQQNSVAKEEKVGFSDPDEEALNKIKQLLNPKVRLERKSVFVPEELNKVMLRLKPYVEQMGIVLSDTINIQYGKKLRFEIGMKKAEINLFYGKKGFSVVQSPRSGTNPEMNKLMADLILDFIDKL